MAQKLTELAVVTGAASGIGRALAIGLCRRNANLALSDIKMSALEETKALCQKLRPDVKINIYQVDVASDNAVNSFAETVKKDFQRPISMLINNAGIAHVANFDVESKESFDRVMNINFNGAVNCTRAFLPQLKESAQKEKSQIVNISSMYGFFTAKGNSPYHASKFALRAFGESLKLELSDTAPNMSVHSVHPGFINTNIVKNATFDGQKPLLLQQFDQIALTTSEQAAEIILNGVKQNRFRILITPEAYVLDYIVRLFPGIYAYPKLNENSIQLALLVSKVCSRVRDASNGMLGDFGSLSVVFASLTLAIIGAFGSFTHMLS